MTKMTQDWSKNTASFPLAAGRDARHLSRAGLKTLPSFQNKAPIHFASFHFDVKRSETGSQFWRRHRRIPDTTVCRYLQTEEASGDSKVLRQPPLLLPPPTFIHLNP